MDVQVGMVKATVKADDFGYIPVAATGSILLISSSLRQILDMLSMQGVEMEMVVFITSLK